MKKFIDFFKKVGSDLYEWFIASNRWMHIICGGLIYIFMVAITAVWNPYDPNALQAIVVGTFATFIAMCAVEYKDKARGLVWDWKDINAGMLPAFVIDILCVILMICK